MKNLNLTTLEARPPWHVVRWLKRLTIVVFIIAVLMIIFGLIAGHLYMQIPSDEESPLETFYGALSTTLEDAGYYGISIGFYALILWLVSYGVDKIDQLVWLNANQTDREYIYKQRVKTDAKN